MESDLCNSIWKFSAEHDFSIFIDQNLHKHRLLDQPTNLNEIIQNSLREVETLTMEIETMKSIAKQKIQKTNNSTNKEQNNLDIPIIKKVRFETPNGPKSNTTKFTVKKKSKILKKLESLQDN